MGLFDTLSEQVSALWQPAAGGTTAGAPAQAVEPQDAGAPAGASSGPVDPAVAAARAEQGAPYSPDAGAPPMMAALVPLEKDSPDEQARRAADREQAAAELRGKFHIVSNPDEVDGNSVTQEQYDKVVGMYSDIRLGKSNIEIGGNLKGEELEEYRRKTMTDIGRILQTDSGRELLDKTMNAKNKAGENVTTVLGPAGVNPDTGKPNDPTTVATDDKQSKNGQGSSTSISYNPLEDVDAPIQDQGGSWGNTWRSDVALYHELVHSQHMHDGKVADSEKQEEMNTVGMGSGFNPQANPYFENRYRHERRMIGHEDPGGPYSSPAVVDGDVGMAQRDNFKGGEGGMWDWKVPYTYADDKKVREPGAQ